MSITLSGRNNVTLSSLQEMASKLKDGAIIRAKTNSETKVEVLYQKTKLPSLFSKNRAEIRQTRQNLARDMIKESLKTAISGYNNQIKSLDIKENMAKALMNVFEKHIPSHGDVKAKDVKAMIKDANLELDKAKELEAQRKLESTNEVNKLGREMPIKDVRQMEQLLITKVGKLSPAPQGKTAQEVSSKDDHFRKIVPVETKVEAFKLFEGGKTKDLELKHVVGLLKSAYENQPVMSLESLKRLMSDPCVKLAVGTLTGDNIPNQPKIGSDSPKLVQQGVEGLKKLVNEVLSPTEKKELKERMTFLATYGPVAKSKFGLAERGEENIAMQNKQWIKSATVSYGLFSGLPQESITKGTNVRQTGVQARDLFTALAMHHEQIFEEESSGVDLDKVLNNLGKQTQQNPTSFQVTPGDNKGLWQVDELMKELEKN